MGAGAHSTLRIISTLNSKAFPGSEWAFATLYESTREEPAYGDVYEKIWFNHLNKNSYLYHHFSTFPTSSWPMKD